MPSSIPDIDGFMKSLGKVSGFRALDVVADLQAASLTASNMSAIKSYFSNTGSTRSNCIWDGTDCSQRVQALAAASTAAVVPTIDDHGKGFAALVNQEPALQVPKNKIQDLITPIYAEHINTQLAVDGFSTLRQLYADSSFTSAFATYVKGPFFNPFQDQLDDHFALNVLFTYEYFSLGPDFVMPQDVTKTSSFQMVQQWQSTLSVSQMAKDQLVARTKGYGFALSGIFSATGTADAQLSAYVAALANGNALFPSAGSGTKSAVHDSSIAQLIEDAKNQTLFSNDTIEEYNQATSYQLWYQWNTALSANGSFWQAAVMAAEAAGVTDGGTSAPFVYTINMIYGADLVQWAKDNTSQGFINAGADVNNFVIEEHSIFEGACFSAGTQVLTDQGLKPIERLSEGDKILTRADPQQYGTVSDEDVIRRDPKHLFGFNGEREFFTPGHVFFTTTGLRAIVPEIARAENPWLDVGKLQVGHILLHSSDGKEYQHVQIKSIRGRTSQEQLVYGVHLREGLRSYHANGYLVALNYPEITVSSIAAQLQEIPQAQRLRLLSQSSAVIPYLRRFGGQTVLEAIEREAKSPSPLYGGKVQPVLRFSIRELIMPFLLCSNDSMRCLARVELHSGVLRIDSKLCEQASFDGIRLSWSRQINNGEWEHAYCTFSKKRLQAEGRLIRSKEKTPAYEEVAANFTRFKMIPGVLANEAGHRKVHHAVKSGAMKKLLRVNDDDPSLWSWSIQYDPQPFNDSADPTTWKPSVPCGSVTMDIIDNVVDYDSLTIDLYDQVSDAMLSNCKKTLPNVDAQNVMDQMRKLYEHTASSGVDSQIYHTFSVLYAEKILQASDEYKTWLQQNPDYLDQSIQPPNRNLHFTGIGMDASFVIPVLFQSLKLTTAPDGSTVSGIFTEFDIYESGRNGKAHWVAGNHTTSTEITLSDALAEASHATRSAGNSKLSAHTVPEADIIEHLASPRLDDDNDLMNDIIMSPYDQNTVNGDVQTLFKNVMAWHMKDSERELLGIKRPADLPAQFTTDLVGSDTATWLANTYARAYICQILAQDDSQLRSQYRFTAKEIKNIRYFWTGQGGGCLAKSGIYQALERNLTRYQIRTNYPPVLTAYNASGGQGGLAMSTKLFKNYTSAFGLGAFGNTPSSTATTLLTKLTAIMDALDNASQQTYSRKIWQDDTSSQTITVTDTNSNQLTYIVLARKNWPLWHSPYWGNPNVNDSIVANTLEDHWLQDTLQDIVLKLLSNDPSITSPTLIAMGKEIEAWGKQLIGWDAMTPKDQSLLVISSFGGRIRAMMAGLAVTFGWIRSGGSWIIAKGQAMVASWKNGAERIGDVAEEAMEKDDVDPPPPDLPGMTAILGKSLLFLVGAAALGAQIWLLSDTWADAGTAKRGQLIMGVIGSFNNMAQLGTDAIETILRRKGGALDPAGQSICARFDQEYGEFLQNESSVLDVDSSSGVGSAPENLIPELDLIEELDDQEIKAVASEWWMVTGQAPDGFEAALEASLNAATRAARITKAFSIVRGALYVLGYLVSIAAAIFMTWQLVENWSKLSTTDRIFQTIQVALAVIEGIGAAIMVGLGATALITTIAVSLGWAAGSAFATSAVATYFAAASIFASVTIVLAVIGLLVMIALFIWEYTKTPPANTFEQWMQDTGKPWADDSSIQAPDMPTTFSMATTYTMNKSTVQEIQMSFKNTTGADISGIVALEVEFTSGPNASALFSDGVTFQVGDSTKTSAGYCRLESTTGSASMASLNIVQHFVPSGNSGDTKNDVNQVSFQIEGPLKADPNTGLEAPNLTVIANETLTLFVYGTIYTDQLTDNKVPTCYVNETQVWSLDSQEEDVAITRE